jgi:hypothetical protein
MESKRSNAVIDLELYRRRNTQDKTPEQVPKPIPESLLDEVTYHLLMAARAIASHTAQ